ncbi:MAG: AlwI family type II restriction endonuclease [Clostridium sp.]|nr:AlwI family type II restriction endonuclease [Clostridium sp.]
MARVNSRLLFLTTSPRTPGKMIPEIELLIRQFEGQHWNAATQTAFMEILKEQEFYNGSGSSDMALSARDRINRAPKSLGFVKLHPTISLTRAGHALLETRRKEEILLRQMLKFQVPSPYHRLGESAADFCVKPYLEMLRLVNHFGTLTFDELQIFGMQLTDWHRFDEIVGKINKFRLSKSSNRGNYKKFKTEYLWNELKEIFKSRIETGKIRTRESKDESLEKFLKTQSNNMRDYADACFRYLHATGMVEVSHYGRSLSIRTERKDDVAFILEKTDRNPIQIQDEEEYAAYLGNDALPELLTDNKQRLVAKIRSEFKDERFDESIDLQSMKNLLDELIEKKKKASINHQIHEIKDKQLYGDIQRTFDMILNNDIYDGPLMLEWNTWRAMTMLDGGNIEANLNFDDSGNPLSTAIGNKPDIVCNYNDYILTVEVTLMSGQRQYEMEGEPVSRHLGKIKRESGKTCYCLFIAPKVNEACVAHFYALHRVNISYYGGKSVILPLPLSVFRKMLEDSYSKEYVPDSEQVKRLFEFSERSARECCDENMWYESVKERALHWLD